MWRLRRLASESTDVDGLGASRMEALTKMEVDLVHDRARIIAEEDRIRDIHRILSSLDMKYVIQTSTLSTKWKHIWISIPNLNLDSQMFRNMSHFAKFVKHVLSNRNHRTKVSAVEVTFKGSFNQFVVKSIVDYAYLHNVEQLTLNVLIGVEHNVFPQCSSQTLKHLTLTISEQCQHGGHIPKSAWDFPSLETLSLSNMQFGEYGDKSFDLFSKCVNLKDLTLDRFTLWNLSIFNVCAPQLSNLTITNPYSFPKVFNVVAPQLENLSASIITTKCEHWGCTERLNFLQLSTEGLNSLEKVNLYLPRPFCEKDRYAPRLLNLFQKLCSAKFLILDMGIIEALSSCLDQLSDEPCPFNNLKCLKIDKQKKNIATVPTQVRNYFLESSRSATFIMDLPQDVYQKTVTGMYGEDIVAHPRVDTMGGRKKRRLYNFDESDSMMTALPGGSSSTNRLNNAPGPSAADEIRQLRKQIEETRVEMEVREQQLQAKLAARKQAMQAQIAAREQVLKAEMNANMEARMKAFEAIMFANI
ncbi:hypothetical protein OSB04_un000516 [Centaurea solstitialis]|uniref:Uncharacterized protein n=1 Tax=Centaurea solstitialis TaxID=347529 RepID=A0AA38SNG4_9ASTR|nr:hypothetical protein OSB04_un000516 [Centaurea solstitialis]